MSVSGSLPLQRQSSLAGNGRSNCRGSCVPQDKDSLIRYSRAVRRLHDRRLAQVTQERTTSIVATSPTTQPAPAVGVIPRRLASSCSVDDRRSSWHVESTRDLHTSIAVSPMSIDDGRDSLDWPAASTVECRKPRERFASTQCLTSPLSEKPPLVQQRQPEDTRSNVSWTPLGRKARFSSFWSLSSARSASEECLVRCTSFSNLKDNDSGMVMEPPCHVRATSADQTRENDPDTSSNVSVRVRRRNYATSRLTQSQSQHRLSLDLERRQNVTKAMSWVREQMQEIHETNQLLAQQMSTMLGSVKSLKQELEEEEEEEVDVDDAFQDESFYFGEGDEQDSNHDNDEDSFSSDL
eukprot:scpid56603/ scgid11365/ 